MDFQSLVVPAVLTPIILYAALFAQKHSGPRAAGLIISLPSQLAIGSVGVGLALGDSAAAQLCLDASTLMTAQVAYGLAFMWGMSRSGVALALSAAMVAYSVAIAATYAVSPVIGAPVAVLVMIAGGRFVKFETAPVDAEMDRSRQDAMTVFVGTLGVLGVLVLVEILGTGAAAFLAAMPVVSSILSIAQLKSRGTVASSEIMGGMIKGLSTYFVFSAVVALLAEPVGIVFAALAALTATLLTAAVLWKLGNPQRMYVETTENEVLTYSS